jgi:tetratricopeptide (TPR) repeat protein
MCKYRSIHSHNCRGIVIALPLLLLCPILALPLPAQTPNVIGSPFGWHSDEFDVMDAAHNVVNSGLGYTTSFPAPSAATPAVPSKVSVDELRHPLTGKARRVLLHALNYIQKGEHSQAIATLQEGMAKVHSIIPYAHSLLGIEYMRTGRTEEAVPEFAEAVSSFPHDPGMRSNLAVSLCAVGQLDRAEQEARMALYLDPQLGNAQEILRILDESRGKSGKVNSAAAPE